MYELDRRGRRTQLETLELLLEIQEPATEADVVEILGGEADSVGRRLRRYRRRGWLGVEYGPGGPAYFVRDAGVQRARWIRANCCRTVKETNEVQT